MGKEYEDEYDGAAGITENQAQRLVECVIDQGLSKEQAYYTLAYVMNAVPKEVNYEG